MFTTKRIDYFFPVLAQEEANGSACKKGVFFKFSKVHRKTPASDLQFYQKRDSCTGVFL